MPSEVLIREDRDERDCAGLSRHQRTVKLYPEAFSTEVRILSEGRVHTSAV
jgi:hypothetical protein